MIDKMNYKNMGFKILDILYIILCIPITILLIFYLSIITLLSFAAIDYQIIFYLLISIIAIIGLWILLILKIKIYYKLIIFLAILGYFYLSLDLPIINKAFNINQCIDIGICAEGLTTKIDGINAEIVTKESCINNGFKWNDIQKNCNLREH